LKKQSLALLRQGQGLFICALAERRRRIYLLNAGKASAVPAILVFVFSFRFFRPSLLPKVNLGRREGREGGKLFHGTKNLAEATDHKMVDFALPSMQNGVKLKGRPEIFMRHGSFAEPQPILFK